MGRGQDSGCSQSNLSLLGARRGRGTLRFPTALLTCPTCCCRKRARRRHPEPCSEPTARPVPWAPRGTGTLPLHCQALAHPALCTYLRHPHEQHPAVLDPVSWAPCTVGTLHCGHPAPWAPCTPHEHCPDTHSTHLGSVAMSGLGDRTNGWDTRALCVPWFVCGARHALRISVASDFRFVLSSGSAAKWSRRDPTCLWDGRWGSGIWGSRGVSALLPGLSLEQKISWWKCGEKQSSGR